MKAHTDAIHAFRSNVPCTTQAGLRGRRDMRHRCKDFLASMLIIGMAIATGWAQPANADPFVPGVHLTMMETRIPEDVLDHRHASVRLGIEFTGARHDPSKPHMIDRGGEEAVRSVVHLLVSTLGGSGNEAPGARFSLSFGPQTPHQDFDASSDDTRATELAVHHSRSDSERRKGADGFAVEAGYSMPAFSGHFSSMPYAGLSASGQTTLGLRFAAKRRDLDFAVVATRNQGAGTGNHLGLELRMRW